MDSNISIKSAQANHAYTQSISIERAREKGVNTHTHIKLFHHASIMCSRAIAGLGHDVKVNQSQHLNPLFIYIAVCVCKLVYQCSSKMKIAQTACPTARSLNQTFMRDYARSSLSLYIYSLFQFFFLDLYLNV